MVYQILVKNAEKIFIFESAEDEEFKQCWNIRNLRLLEKNENLKKGGKLDLNLIKEYNIEDLLPRRLNGNV